MIIKQSKMDHVYILNQLFVFKSKMDHVYILNQLFVFKFRIILFKIVIVCKVQLHYILLMATMKINNLY